MNQNTVHGAQAITRAIQLLKLFDDNHPRWELSALAEASELNKTTVFRILSALEAEGLIARTKTGAYTLGSELIALGGRAARANELRTIAHDYLQDLAEQTGETVTLEILRLDRDGRWGMLVIDEVLGQHLVGITQYIGSRLPVHATSTGKAILAFLDEGRRATIIKEALASPTNGITAHTIIDPVILVEELAQVRERGYAYALGELESGLMAVGVPVFDYNGIPQASISIVGPSIRVKPEHLPRLASKATQVAQVLSHKLGYRHHP